MVSWKDLEVGRGFLGFVDGILCGQCSFMLFEMHSVDSKVDQRHLRKNSAWGSNRPCCLFGTDSTACQETWFQGNNSKTSTFSWYGMGQVALGGACKFLLL